MRGVERAAAREFWNFTPPLPLRSAPFLHWPPRPLAIGRHLVRTWWPLSTRVFMLAVSFAVWAWTMPSPETASDLAPGWIAAVWTRNLILVAAVAGGLHLWLHVLRKQSDELRYDLRPLGRNKRIFLFGDQVADNVVLTLGPAVLAWTVAEVLMLWAYANGHAPTISWHSNPVWFVALILIIPVWSIVYFSIGHRLLHVGPAYRHVHSWHHKNVNVGPWSGLAMHPAEHVVLFADVIILFVLPSHPMHLYFVLMHHGLGAPMSHTGYDALLLARRFRFELGDFHHQLHHRFIECNYGGTESPLDEWLGSFHDGTSDGDRATAARRRELAATRSGRSTRPARPTRLSPDDDEKSTDGQA